jgi:hypothetical protein
MAEGRETVSLREYVDTRFAAQESAVQAALASAEKAVVKAESAAERRFDSVNEFRATLADQARLLMPRAEAESAMKSLTEKLDALQMRVNARDDRGRGMGDIWGYIVGAVGILALVIGYLRGHP